MRELLYCKSPFVYQRRLTREVKVGNVGIGGANPIRVQSMITCDTMDTEMSIQQTIALTNVGCRIVRITAPTVKDARNLEHIVKGLHERGCNVPIVADIHFKPEAAMEAAKWVDKVRINPGNYADSKKFVIREYTDEQYAAELARIRERFSPLVELCKKRGIAVRIGTNHGSLSDRILNRYGDTPLGMVESALEFARIARDLDYHDFIFSMKASNPKIMIAAYRLLVARLSELGPDWNYPLHLGVTEAGEGEDARIKSAIGIGSLLADGIGDTIRVSLTEDSPYEIPVARALIEKMGDYKPEIIYEAANIAEVDPCDDSAVAKINSESAPQLVTVCDDVELPVIAAFRLLAAKLHPRHPILLTDVLSCKASVSAREGFRSSQKRPTDFLQTLLTASTNIGSLLCDGIGDAILV